MTEYLNMHGSNRLTKKEAEALLYAVGNSADHPDVMDSLFPDGREARACHNAIRKISDCLYYLLHEVTR